MYIKACWRGVSPSKQPLVLSSNLLGNTTPLLLINYQHKRCLPVYPIATIITYIQLLRFILFPRIRTFQQAPDLSASELYITLLQCGSVPGMAVKEAWRLFRKRGSLGCAS